MSQRRQRRDHDDPEDADEDAEHGDASPDEQLAKKMVRYVLACEFSRTSIRRDGVKDKGMQ